ncbi:hypothetical protein GALMADRAFT_1068826 [Galerina marginata CBS 339.88]|uniref:N-acetyltransferase domain-containing protein n=1 Tax=Galerina marginata (strain CBS 339.88) TaxID=685588 RepID=A0A067SLG7_GALM3|nr:hypothetical protein GALMADRAFT_1068826 [Galerina marginata CBS 339.88]
MVSDSDEESEYTEKRKVQKPRPRKRAKRVKEEPCPEEPLGHVEFPLQSLLSVLWTDFRDEDRDDAFDQLIEPMVEDLLRSREAHEKNLIELDDTGKKTRPLRPAELSIVEQELMKKDSLSPSEALVLRKIKLERQRKLANVKEPKIIAPDSPLTLLPPASSVPPVNPEVLDALYSIKTTPFANSFLSRLHGTKETSPGLISVDWETRTPWMDLMTDIHDHYTLAHPEREHPIEEPAPLTYFTLHAYHLPQVHDLLEKSFWSGIDVSDSLDYVPEKSTVIAMYKKVVVGVAIIISPIQTYITYLAVKAGWDKAQIARTMLYHLICMNPGKDFTLHVSTNSSAMLLYNQFGFKIEEFVAGFYSEYLDPNSRASKNAFKLRLRHL